MPAPPSLPVPARPVEPPAWRRRAFWIQSLAGGLVGGVATIGVLRAVDGADGPFLLLIVGAILVTGWVQVLVHEAGHIVAGLAVGLRPLAFGVGPLRGQRVAGGWRFHRAAGIRGIGGFAVLLPPEGRQSARQTSAYLLGGPLANLLAAAVAVGLVASGAAASDTALVFAWTTAATGLALGLVNLVPFVSGGWSSDGRQLLKLWQGKDEARVSAALVRLSGLAMTGVRPRDWAPLLPTDVNLREAPQAVGDALARCRLVQAIDARHFDDPLATEAATRLAAGFWDGPDGIRATNALLLARWVLDARGDVDGAAQWCALGEGGLMDQTAQRAAIEARIALARGDLDGAEASIALAERNASRIPDAASQAMHAEDIADLRDRLAHRRVPS